MKDRFTYQEEVIKRLKDEKRKYGSLIVAVDFDETLYDYHNRGDVFPRLISLVRKLHFKGHKIIIWTANGDLEHVKSQLKKHSIPYDKINENIVDLSKKFDNTESRKIYYNILLDDRAGLSECVEILELVI